MANEKTNEPTFEQRVHAQFEGAENVRPEMIAAALNLPNGKQVRGFLRATFTRPIEMKGSTWLLSNEQALATIDHFLARRQSIETNAPSA